MNSHGIAAITGATGGLGTAFARAAARRGYDLFLTDQAADDLESLASRLREDHGISVEATVADLTRDEDVQRISAQLAAGNVALLINNAGFGTYSLFSEADLTRQLDMVQVHVLASMSFCHAVLPGMIARHRGSIINVASASAFMRFPRDATYIGAKSFLVAFTECLAIELVGTGVAVQALCPGWVRTGFSKSGDFAEIAYRSPIPGWLFTSPERVVASALHSVGTGPVTYVPTIRARIASKLIGSRLGLAVLAWIRRRRIRRVS